LSQALNFDLAVPLSNSSALQPENFFYCVEPLRFLAQ
jgi:hypothetical protein